MRLAASLPCIVVFASGMLVSFPLLAAAEAYQMIAATERGTLSIGISTEPQSPKPGDSAKLKIDFLNPQTKTVQQHIDYTVTVTRDGDAVFGPIQLTHTSTGKVTIPVQFRDGGKHQITVDVQGILFQPMPSEKASFSIMVGEDTSSQPKEEPKAAEAPMVQKSEKPKPALPDVDKNKAAAKDKTGKDKTGSKQKSDKKPYSKSDKKTKKAKKSVKKPKAE